MAVLTLVFFGIVAIQGLGLDLLPDLQLPIAAVITIYPGADPSTVETAVTDPLENLDLHRSRPRTHALDQ